MYEGWKRGLEPPTPGSTIQCSNQLSYFHRKDQARIEEAAGSGYFTTGRADVNDYQISAYRIARKIRARKTTANQNANATVEISSTTGAP